MNAAKELPAKTEFKDALSFLCACWIEDGLTVNDLIAGLEAELHSARVEKRYGDLSGVIGTGPQR